eukprot:TRINITY_DN12788_c0_g2_i7.p1 TRINITY_DN12788_c0_g2~~TRINITY_DN12788_c0_g2_i7.p1  ORF type:complete len:195 (-),score=43.11 TRINITY_DN12788_c0_g2_i7:43-627(-)
MKQDKDMANELDRAFLRLYLSKPAWFMQLVAETEENQVDSEPLESKKIVDGESFKRVVTHVQQLLDEVVGSGSFFSNSATFGVKLVKKDKPAPRTSLMAQRGSVEFKQHLLVDGDSSDEEGDEGEKKRGGKKGPVQKRGSRTRLDEEDESQASTNMDDQSKYQRGCCSWLGDLCSSIFRCCKPADKEEVYTQLS